MRLCIQVSSERVLALHARHFVVDSQPVSSLIPCASLPLTHSSRSSTAASQYVLHPYLHSFSNTRSTADLLHPLSVPDVLPSALPSPCPDFSFAAGDFLEIYRGADHEGRWDAVATCFFIDTARNIVDYLERIWAVLRPGGVWLNCGMASSTGHVTHASGTVADN